MIGQLVRVLGCFLLAAWLTVLLLIGLQLPLPPDPTPDQVLDPIWHGFTAEVDLRLFESERKLAAAHQLVELDPALSGLGRDGARYLARHHAEPEVRAQWQERLVMVDGRTESRVTEAKPKTATVTTAPTSTLPTAVSTATETSTSIKPKPVPPKACRS